MLPVPVFTLVECPETENVPVSVYEDAIVWCEQKLGLENQPRVIVFHEKQGRRHAHCVWSRIDADTMKAINLPHTKLKLMDISDISDDVPRRGVASAIAVPSGRGRKRISLPQQAG